MDLNYIDTTVLYSHSLSFSGMNFFSKDIDAILTTVKIEPTLLLCFGRGRAATTLSDSQIWKANIAQPSPSAPSCKPTLIKSELKIIVT